MRRRQPRVTQENRRTADSPDQRSTRSDPGGGTGAASRSTTGMPRWVKISWVIAGVVLLLFVVMMLLGGHDPGRHMQGDPGGHTPHSDATHYGWRPSWS